MSYDQWKTANPYDDMPETSICIHCQSLLPDEDDIIPGTPQDEGFCSKECMDAETAGGGKH